MVFGGLFSIVQYAKNKPLHLSSTLKAATLRVQRIDNRHRRRMFRPFAEIARTESLTLCPTNIRSTRCPLQNATHAAGLCVQ